MSFPSIFFKKCKNLLPLFPQTMLRREDAGIDRAVIRTDDGDGDGGTRIAADTSVQTLLKAGPFQLVINDVAHRYVEAEKRKKEIMLFFAFFFEGSRGKGDTLRLRLFAQS